MRKLKLQMQVSLDLYISGNKEGMNWMIWPYTGKWNWDEALKKYFTEVTASIDTILLGWDMADGGYIDHWTSIANEKNNQQSVFAANVVEAHKLVFSRKKRQSRIFTRMNDILRLIPVSAQVYPSGITVLVYRSR